MHNSSLYQFYMAFSVVSELYSLPPELAHKLHLLHLLRAKLVHFVNNLNNYLITRVTYNFVVNVTFIVLFFYHRSFTALVLSFMRSSRKLRTWTR